MHTKLSSHRGESMIEVLVALLIVVICISMLSTSILTSSRLNRAANESATEDIFITSGTGGATPVPGDEEEDQPGISASVKITVSNTSYLYDGTAKGSGVAVSVRQKGSAVTPTKIEYNTDGIWVTTAPTDINAGDTIVKLRVTLSEGEAYTTAYTLHIAERKVTLTSASDSKAYDGKPLANSDVTVSGDGWAPGEGASYSVTGSQTEPGYSNNTFSYTLNSTTDADNYIITMKNGRLTVVSGSGLALTAPTASLTYNGLLQQSGTVTANLTDGTTIRYSTDGTNWTETPPFFKNVGTYEVYAAASNPSTNDATVTYNVTVNPASVSIKVNNLTITEGETPNYSFTVTGLKNGETNMITVTGYTLSPNTGLTAGTYSIIPKYTAVQGNYKVTGYTAGTLVVEPAVNPADESIAAAIAKYEEEISNYTTTRNCAKITSETYTHNDNTTVNYTSPTGINYQCVRKWGTNWKGYVRIPIHTIRTDFGAPTDSPSFDNPGNHFMTAIEKAVASYINGTGNVTMTVTYQDTVPVTVTISLSDNVITASFAAAGGTTGYVKYSISATKGSSINITDKSKTLSNNLEASVKHDNSITGPADVDESEWSSSNLSLYSSYSYVKATIKGYKYTYVLTKITG